MQALAGLELSAAEAMKGQGAITEAERAIIKRASAGDLMTMTASEVGTLLSALEKSSQYKIDSHNANMATLGKNKDMQSILPFYNLQQPFSPTNPPQVDGSMLRAAAAAELLKRQGKQ
jgi:hypothetical protein